MRVKEGALLREDLNSQEELEKGLPWLSLQALHRMGGGHVHMRPLELC